MVAINPASPAIPDNRNPAFCKTEVFYDRDVEFVRCYEDEPCRYKQTFNGMIICVCPTDKPEASDHH